MAVDGQRLADAQSNARYGLVRSLDSTEAIAATLARFMRYDRSYDTLNRLFRVYAALTPDDLLKAARTFLTDQRLVLTTLSTAALPAAMDQVPRLADLAGSGPAAAGDLKFVKVQSMLPQVDVKLQFAVGSAHDPKGKEGLACLCASMIAEAGSKARTIDQINKALFPLAGSFSAQADKEMTTFTASVHRDNWDRFAELVLPMLLEPGFRDEDFNRLKDQQLNALRQDLRTENEEELGKEALQTWLFAGTPYGHPVLGTVAGLSAITLDDVKAFAAAAYTRAALTVGISGDVQPEVELRLRRDLSALPAGPSLPPPAGVTASRPSGMEVQIIQKETRATAISLGHPLDVTRSHPDFAALSVARAWLGEHRSSMSHLYERIRETRGMNYGDYAYIEAFPGGMYRFFPGANVARRAQLFEIWIRPVLPKNAHMALRIAVYELSKLIENGLTEEQFQDTRDYLMKNVYLLTATQDAQLGYALDSSWYGIGEYCQTLRDRLAALTRDDVNRAIKRHLSAKDLAVVMVTQDAEALKQALVADGFSPMTYDAPKPQELLDEDKVIGALRLGIKPEAVTVEPVEDVFGK
jgi:zinc protease